MIKFKNLFSFSKSETESAFKNTALHDQITGFKLLQTPPTTSSKFGKLLIIISKRSGKAHERNLLRRQIKSIFYEEKLFKKPITSILIVYKQATKLTFDEIKKFLTKNLK